MSDLPKNDHDRLQILEMAVENANDAVIVTEADPLEEPGPRVIYANEAFERQTGYRREDLLGRSPRMLHGPGTDPAVREAMSRALRDGEPFIGEVLNYRKDRTPFWVELSIRPVKDRAGKIISWCSIQRDITERKRAQERELGEARSWQAKEIERRLMAIIEATPDLISSAELDGRLRYLNKAGRRLLGLGDRQPLSELRIAAFHPEWALRIVLEEAIPAAIETGSWEGETALVRTDGKEIPVSQMVLAHKDVTGAVAYLSTVVRDISAQKKASEDQRFLVEASSALTRSLEVESVAEAAVQSSLLRLADWSILALPPEGEKESLVIGAHIDADKRNLVESLCGIRPSRGPAPCLSRAMSGKEPMIVRKVTKRWIHEFASTKACRSALLKLEPKSIAVLPLLVGSDLLGVLLLASSTRKRSFDEREVGLAREFALRLALTLNNARQYSRAVQATRDRDEVLAVVSHDLRNPLEAVNLAAAFLGEELEGAGDPHVMNAVALIRRSITRAGRLVQDLLDVTRADAGRLELALERENPVGLIREAVELQSEAANAKDIVIDLAVERSPRFIQVDRHRVLQVLTNLLDNAIRHTPRSGRVRASLRGERGFAVFSVEDTGPGISPGDIPHLFERFWKSADGKSAGAGLGLPISKGIVQAHGGEIWAESRPGRGAVFTFRIPPGPPRQRAGADRALASS